MKRIMFLLGLVALCAVGLGAGAGTASAANCQGNASNLIWYTGVWNWTAVLQNCTGVDAVSFSSGPGGARIDDFSTGISHGSYTGGGQIGGAASSYGMTYSFSVWGPGCGGGQYFLARKNFYWQIHNAATHTWGSVAQTSAFQNLC
jgi:hypothetical protein